MVERRRYLVQTERGKQRRDKREPQEGQEGCGGQRRLGLEPAKDGDNLRFPGTCELALTPARQELKWKLGERRRLDQRTTDDHVRPTQIETWESVGFQRPRRSAAPRKVPALRAEMGSESGAGPEPAIRGFPAPLPGKAWHCSRSRSSGLGEGLEASPLLGL